VFDITGKEVATLLNQEKPAGKYQLTFDDIRFRFRNLFISNKGKQQNYRKKDAPSEIKNVLRNLHNEYIHAYQILSNKLEEMICL